MERKCAHLNPWLSQLFVWLRYLLSSVVGKAERPFLWGSPRVDILKGWWRLGMFVTRRSLARHGGLKAAGWNRRISSSHLIYYASDTEVMVWYGAMSAVCLAHSFSSGDSHASDDLQQFHTRHDSECFNMHSSTRTVWTQDIYGFM